MVYGARLVSGGRRSVYRSKRKMTYHGRSGYPLVHGTRSGRKFIMVRKRGGGVKRMYLKHGTVPMKLRR